MRILASMNKAKEHKTEFVNLVKSVSVECTCYVSVQSNSSDIWLTLKQRVEGIIGTKKGAEDNLKLNTLQQGFKSP